MAEGEPQDSAGPSSPPPSLPEGWLAQWEGVSRKWYYVQRATGKSQWDVPTEPVILTPSTTPGSIGTGPTQAPGSGTRSLSPQTMTGDTSDLDGSRGLFNSSTMRPLLSSVMGSHGNSGFTQMADNLITKFSKDFISPNKHNSNTPNSSSPLNPNNSNLQTPNRPGSNSAQSQAGHNAYGYVSSNQPGTYTGPAPQYHPQGQGNPQQGESFHQPGASHAPYGSTGPSPSGHQQYHAANQPVPPTQFSSMGPVSQPWQSQNSFAHSTAPPTYQQPIASSAQNNGPPMPMPSQPEWQVAARPTMPFSAQPNYNNSGAVPNQPQHYDNHQPPYNQQGPQQYQNQPPQNAYPHGQMTQDFSHHPQNLQGPQPMHANVPQSVNNPEQGNQNVPYQPPQHPPSYNLGGGAASVPSPVPSHFQNHIPMNTASMVTSTPSPQQGNLSHQSSLATLSNQYPGTNAQNNGAPNTHAFAVELPDNQISASRPPPINMQSHPSSGSQNGPPPLQGGVPQNAPQPMSNPIVPGPPGAEPMRHTPTDPQFVSGPWTAPASAANHQYPQNRYYNPGGY